MGSEVSSEGNKMMKARPAAEGLLVPDSPELLLLARAEEENAPSKRRRKHRGTTQGE